MADSPEPIDPKRPDLEETTNVAEAHAGLLESGAAQAREKRLQESGLEPVSLWVFLASAVVLLVGGAVMGAGGKLFRYNPHPEGYVRATFEGAGGGGPVVDTFFNAMMKRGEKTYAKCKGCHGGSGEGDGQKFPPLAGSEWVTGSTEQLSMIILNGLKGKITVKGKVWDENMPSQMPLNKTDLAAVMTYVRNSFGNETGDVVSPEQAAKALEIYTSRAAGAEFAPQITEAELIADHDRMLEGEGIDPETKVDLETLQPVDAAGGGE